jgi:hypothetical protein
VRYRPRIGTPHPTTSWWRRPLAWRAPPTAELGLIGRAALAAGLAWWVGELVSENTTPLLAVFTALVVLQATTRATLRIAFTRSIAVVVGAILGVALGEAVPLTAVTVALLVAAALIVADFAMRLPLAAARQVPIAMVLVLAATTADEAGSIWTRAAQTALGAAIGAGVTLLLPISRVAELRRTLAARAHLVSGVWALIAAGLATSWSTDDATGWRRLARGMVDELGPMAGSREVAAALDATRWTYHRRRDEAALHVLGAWADWLDEAAVSVVHLAEDLERAAATAGRSPAAWPSAAELCASVAAATAATADQATAPTVDDPADRHLRRAATEVSKLLGGPAQPAPLVDERAVAADVDRLVCRLRPTSAAVTLRAASPSPR